MPVTVEIAGADVTSRIKKKTLTITKLGEGNNNFSFVLHTTATIGFPREGQEIIIYDGATVVVGGEIKTISKTRIVPTWGVDADIEVNISCDGYNEIPSRRTVTFEFFNQKAGWIVERMRSLTIDAEGVGAGTIEDGITIPYILQVCISLKQVYDELAHACGKKWYIDESKDLYFIEENVVVDADEVIEEGGTFTDFNDIVITESLGDYRNKVFVKGGWGVDGKLVYLNVEDAAEIAERQIIEGGTGVHGHIIEDSNVTTEADAITLAEKDLQKNCFAPSKIRYTSYKTDWVVGTRLLVNLPSLGYPVDTFYLIEEVSLRRVETNLLQAAIRGTKRREDYDFSTQKSQSGSEFFVKLIREAKKKGAGEGTGIGGFMQHQVRSYYDTNESAITITTAETLVCEKTFDLLSSGNIFIAFSAKIEIERDQSITAKTYFLEEGEYPVVLDYEPEQVYLFENYSQNIHLFTYTDTIEGVSPGEVTIQIKLQTDVGESTVSISGATLSILTIPALSVVIEEVVVLTTVAYVCGGNPSGTTGYLDCDEYTAGTDSWATKTNMPAPPRYGLAASTISGKVYVYAGWAGSTRNQDCDEYTPTTDSWANKTDLPAPARNYLAGSTIGTKGYVYCGRADAGLLQDCDEYDASSDSWANKTDTPAPARESLAGSTIGTKGYIYCGSDAGFLRDCDEYDASGDSWANKTDAPLAARNGLGASTISTKGYIYTGNLGGGSYSIDCDEYDASGDSWANKTDAPLPARAGVSAATIGTKGYIFCGQNALGGMLYDCDEYDPVADSWANKTDARSARGGLYSAASSV